MGEEPEGESPFRMAAVQSSFGQSSGTFILVHIFVDLFFSIIPHLPPFLSPPSLFPSLSPPHLLF